MTETDRELQENLQNLQKENQELRNTCENLQQAQASYEQILSENNASFLQADMERMELEQIFSACTDAMWVVREDQVVVRANDAMLALLDKSTDEVIGKNCYSLLSHQLCGHEKCPLKDLSEKTTYEHDIQLNLEASASKHFMLSSAPLITINGSPGIVAMFKDITSRKEAETALEQANIALESMALRDGLTQIANRRCFDSTLEKEWFRLKREQKPLGLILGDIDFFKKYNDHYGHQAGDDCLKIVAKALADSVLRPADLVARYGGEEFVLLLPDIDMQGLMLVGTRVLEAIEFLSIEHQKSEVSEIVTISLGATVLTPSSENQPSDLVALADAALYRAKMQGRNRIVPTQPVQGGSVQNFT